MSETTPPAENKLLSSMAILQVNWEYEGRSYLDNFLTFLVESMRRNPQPSYTDSQISELLQKEFALDIPDSVVHSLLRRAKRKQLGDRNKAGRFVPSRSALEADVELAAKQAEILREQRSLVAGYIEFAKTTTGVELDGDDASSDLTAFIDKYAAPILGAAHRGERPLHSDLSRQDETTLAAYLEHLHDMKPVEFEYLVNVARGAMLASSIFRDEITPLDDRFSNTDLYLDTPVIFRCLGFFGNSAQATQLSMISGAASFGARLRVFEQTIAEVKGVIESVAKQMRSSTFSPDERHIGLNFVKQGFTAEEVRAVSARVERDIGRLGVEIVQPPKNTLAPIDEIALGSLLAEHRPYYPRNALAHDVEALIWIRAIRRGRASDRLERSRATFVTTNPRLIIGAEEFPAFAGERYPLAAFEDRVATLVWLKTPLAYPDLPRDQLIARVAALLSPTKQVWAKYLEQIERLRSRGAIDESDEILLRQHYEAGRALVDETSNDATVVTETSVTNVLARVKSELARPLIAQTEQLQADNAMKQQFLEAQVALAKGENDALQVRLTARIAKVSEVVAGVLYWLLTVAAVVAVALSWFLDWPLLGKIIQGLVLLALLFGSVLGPLHRLRETVSKAIERQLRRIVGIG